MLKSISISPVIRAVLVVGAVAALVTGVTFAALDSEATLTDNDLASATVGLQVNNTDNGGDPAATDTGFDITGLVPGSEYLPPGYHFSLTNTGDTDMRVKVKVTGGTESGTVDKTKVHFRFDNTTDATSSPVEYTWAELEAAGQTLPGVSDPDDLGVAETNHFDMRVKLDADAITGSSASIDDFTFTFTGSSFAE